MSDHKHQLPARVPTALLIVAAVLASLTGGDGQTPRAPWPRSHAASLVGAPATTTVMHRLGSDDTTELVDEVGPALVDLAAQGADGDGFGTGIVLSEDGLVLTNYHVIANAHALRAADLGNGRTYRANVVGADAHRDIALIQLAGAGGLRTATLGDSDDVRLGEQVASLGNTDGELGGRPSVGIGAVTGLGESIDSTTEDGAALTGLIEARTHIVPGDSGGPMVNDAGEVIGMNVAYATTPGSSRPNGFGYAIPINTALKVAHRILVDSTH